VWLYDRSCGSCYLESHDSSYWLAEGEGQPLDGGGRKSTGKRLKTLPRQFPLDRLFVDAVDAEAIWCSGCNDWLPWTDEDVLCVHIHWCHEHGGWTGSGYDDPCSCK
jgi:hypothetical protein